MNVETERIKPADDDDVYHTDKIENSNEKGKGDANNKENTTVFGAGDEDCLAVPKKNNIRRISDEFKITASGALGTGKDGIKKAASGISSGLKTVTNRIQLPKSPKAFRRRSWHAYDELEDDEEHIIAATEKESISDDDRREYNKKDKDKKSKTKDKLDSKEKVKKEKKEKKDKSKSKKTSKGKIDWCSGDGLIDTDDSKLEEHSREEHDDDELDHMNSKSDEPIMFESLDSVGLISKVTISVEEA